jgi:hypothetical protein
MRDEEFKKRLTEVADWYTPVDIDSKTASSKIVDRCEDQQPNDTLSPKILKLKYAKATCQDCGKIVQGRHKDIQLYKRKNNVGFKEKCLACGLHKDPYTGKFNITGTEAAIKWSAYFRRTRTAEPKPAVKIACSAEPKTQSTVIYDSQTETIIDHCEKSREDK